MQLKQSLLTYLDKLWCGNCQVPASLLFEVSDDTKTTTILASFRLSLGLCLFAELLGYFFITLGLSASRPIWTFITGVILKISGGLIGAFFQNKSGTFLSLELQKYLKKLSSHSLEIRSFLTDRGCSEQEISSLQSLPSEVYQSELTGYQRARVLNIGAPISCGLALFANADVVTSLIVIFLGLASFPIGENFFKETIFRRDSELRLGLASQLLEFVGKIYREHVWLTAKVNFLSQLPLLLFSIRLIWNGSGQLLSTFFGLTQGLVGLTGTLAFQNARVAAIRTTDMALHLINALSSPYLIVTPQRWNDHCKSEGEDEVSIFTKLEDGVLLKNFAPILPFKEKEIFSLSSIIPSGSICILKALSGKGKSTFLLSLNHLIEHKGDFFFIEDGKILNVHKLSRNEFESKIFFFREENADKGMRLVDLFKKITFIKNEPFLQDAKTHFDKLLVDLAWNCPDNLIQHEINNIEANKKSVFPNKMLDFLKNLRKRQSDQIQSFFNASGGNLVTDRIVPERNFSTLSSGEKRRITILLALESCKAIKSIRLVILDEPLTHLDETNINYQMQVLQELQELPLPPSILIISHLFVIEMKNKLLKVQEIEL